MISNANQLPDFFLPQIAKRVQKTFALQDEFKSISGQQILKPTPPQKTYRLICVLDSVSQGKASLSTLDASPDYLHIHALDSEILPSISEFKKTLPQQTENSVLTQWGIPLELAAKSRSQKISSQEIKQHGQVGIGSAFRGNERSGNFSGGGEGFLFGSQNFRITKGGEAFEVRDEEGFWTFQVTDFANAQAISDSAGREVSGRKQLLDMLKEKSNGKPFVAVFDVNFHLGSFVRSNGIFPEDEVVRRTESTFDAKSDQTRGGHLVGGSSNKGDLLSLCEKLGSASQAAANNFSLTIKSEILLKPVDELTIARIDGSFRVPNTEIQTRKAAIIIQSFLKSRGGLS